MATSTSTVSLPETNGWGFGTHRYDRGPLERLRRQQRPVVPSRGVSISGDQCSRHGCRRAVQGTVMPTRRPRRKVPAWPWG